LSKVKEILFMHHSHLDIGYTHPQPLLLELQSDYIDEAIDLCIKTEDYPEEAKFRWTCEATLPVLKWLETATEERVKLFKRYLNNGQISISAMLMHSTPLANSEEIAKLLYPIKQLRKQFDIPLNTAINHDVNGQPWPTSQILLDAGIDFYITGINIHFGGIPFERPHLFNWKTPDSRHLLTFLGEHYSLFSQFFKTYENDSKLVREGVDEYLSYLDEKGYDKDFIFLTATNPPLFDNNPPDPDLPDLIKKFNEENNDIKIKFVTPEMLYERVKNSSDIKEYAGDWTDYWNFGSGSSARETRLSRKTKQNLKITDFLESVQGAPNAQYHSVKKETVKQSLLYEEHTWGAAQNITHPDQLEVMSQISHKKDVVYKASDLSAYVLGKQMEKLSGNPIQSTEPEGVLLVNVSPNKQHVPVYLPDEFLYKGRHLSARRLKTFLPYFMDDNKADYTYYGSIEMDGFSWKKIPLDKLENYCLTEDKFEVLDDKVETPFYTLRFNHKTGRLKGLYSKENDWDIIDQSSEWTLFDYVYETINKSENENNRSTFFPRDIDLGNKSISVWNHSWSPIRRTVEEIIDWEIQRNKDQLTYIIKSKADGVKTLEQRLTFYSHDSKIEFNIQLNKEDVRTPESVYFALPLNLEKDWQSHYDTAGMFVELDKEQLGNVSKDWVTVDQTVSIYDNSNGVTVACPDAPLVQIGDFNFGKESESIKRNENPKLLLWAMNNYWDTNFWASQSGNIQFTYVLDVFKEFKPTEAYALGQYASNTTGLNAVIDCDEGTEGTFFTETTENIVPVYVKPGQEGGIILTLRNLSRDPSDYELKFNDNDYTQCTIVDTLEQKIKEVEIENNLVKLSMDGGQLINLKVEK